MTNEHIGERIRRLRHEKNLSQKQFANDLGFNSPATVSAWESGKAQLSSDIIIAIAGYFGVSTDYLLVGHRTDSTKDELLRNRLREIHIFENLEWKGRRSHVFVMVLTLLTIIVQVFKHVMIEYVTLVLFLCWLTVFFVYAIKVLVSPFRPTKSVFINDSKDYTYESSLSKDHIKKRHVLYLALIICGFVLSLVTIILTIMLTPSFKIPLTGNLYVLFSLLSLVMMVYQFYRMKPLNDHDSSLRLKRFNVYASIDSHTIDLLLTGMTFIALFGYVVLFAREEKMFIFHTTTALLGIRFLVSLTLYAHHRTLVSTYSIKETFDS